MPSKRTGSLAAVVASLMVANIAGYLLHITAGRRLGAATYSSFASLLMVQLLMIVPALATQIVVAREVVRGTSTTALRRLEVRGALIMTVVVAGASPAVAIGLRVNIVATIAAMLAAPASMLLHGELGLLQGSGRFARFASLFAVSGIGRSLPPILALTCGYGVIPTLAAGTVTMFVVAAIARVVAGTATTAATIDTVPSILSVIQASQMQLVLMALLSIDPLAARVLLAPGEAGRYALGAVAAKAALWCPQAVSMVWYPRMAHPTKSAAAIRSTLTTLVAVGALLVAVAALAAPLAPQLVGPGYRPIVGKLWLYVWDGAALAVLQGGLLAAVASKRTRPAWIAWIGFAASLLTITTWGHSSDRLLGTAVVTATVTAALTAGLCLAYKGKAPTTGDADTTAEGVAETAAPLTVSTNSDLGTGVMVERHGG